MVRTSAAAFVREQIAEAVRQGARPLIDPSEFPADRDATPYLAPQVLVEVDHRMRVMTEVTFGPVVGLMAVKDDDEAVGLMNDSRYGLTASIWTTDVEAAIGLGDRVETGTWFLNRCDYLDPALAWTGVKDSGRGCSLSRLGYETVTRPKSFHLRLVLCHERRATADEESLRPPSPNRSTLVKRHHSPLAGATDSGLTTWIGLPAAYART
jgi:acyl-CoA reductase-like NAD-dependent aldehyde dehydrogenase